MELYYFYFRSLNNKNYLCSFDIFMFPSGPFNQALQTLMNFIYGKTDTC